MLSVTRAFPEEAMAIFSDWVFFTILRTFVAGFGKVLSNFEKRLHMEEVTTYFDQNGKEVMRHGSSQMTYSSPKSMCTCPFLQAFYLLLHTFLAYSVKKI